MLRRIVCALLWCCPLLCLPGCHRKPALEEAPGQPNPASLAQGATEQSHSNRQGVDPTATLLQVQWHPGSRYVYRMEVDQRSTTTLAQTNEPTREALLNGLTFALSVRGPLTNGGAELELQFLACDMEIKVGDTIAVAFDTAAASSNQPALKPPPAPFRRLVGSTLRLDTEPNGALARIVGLDSWRQQVAGDASGPAGQMIVQQLNEGFFQQLLGFAKGLPARPVRAGESWPLKADLPAGALGVIQVDSTITFTEWQEHDQSRLAVLESKGTLRSASAPSDTAGASMSLEQGTVSGKAWFDPKAGTLVESIVEQTMRLKGKASASTDGERGNGEFTSDIDQKVTLKLAELSATVAEAR